MNNLDRLLAPTLSHLVVKVKSKCKSQRSKMSPNFKETSISEMMISKEKMLISMSTIKNREELYSKRGHLLLERGR